MFWVPNTGRFGGGQGPHECVCVGNAGHGWSILCSPTLQITLILRGSILAGSSERSNHS